MRARPLGRVVSDLALLEGRNIIGRVKGINVDLDKKLSDDRSQEESAPGFFCFGRVRRVFEAAELSRSVREGVAFPPRGGISFVDIGVSRMSLDFDDVNGRRSFVMGIEEAAPDVSMDGDGPSGHISPALEGVDDPLAIREEDHARFVGSVENVLKQRIGLGRRGGLDGSRKRPEKAGDHVRDAVPRGDLDHPITAPGGSLVERCDTRSVAERATSELIDHTARANVRADRRLDSPYAART